MKKVLLLISLFLNLSVTALEYPFNSPYQCLSSHTSKRSGKTYTTLNYIHPKKGWLIKLSGVKKPKTMGFGVANLYTPKGRYDGHYKGVYPKISEVKFLTFWPSLKPRVEKMMKKIKVGDCKKLSDASVFNLSYLGSLECMDPKKTGGCKAE